MFDTALIESAVPGTFHHLTARRARSLSVAIGFHALVLGALVLSALASTSEPPEPNIPIAFPSSFGGPPPPPAPPGGPTPIHAVLPPKTSEVAVSPVRIPDEVPIDLATVAESPASTVVAGEEGPAGSGPGEPGGQPGGLPGGIPGGTGPGDEPATDEPYEPGVGGVTHPEIVERVDPIYPEAMRRAHVQGTIVLEAVITAAGVVEELRIVASAGPMLDAAAAAAVSHWRYKPATLNGRAVPVRLTVTVRFGLTG